MHIYLQTTKLNNYNNKKIHILYHFFFFSNLNKNTTVVIFSIALIQFLFQVQI